MYERFTDAARWAHAHANNSAKNFNREFILPEDFLYGLIKYENGKASKIFRKLGLDNIIIYNELEKRVKGSEKKVIMGKLPLAPHSKKVIEVAIEYSKSLNHNHIGTEHLGYAVFSIYGGIAREILISHLITQDNYEKELKLIINQDNEPLK